MIFEDDDFDFENLSDDEFKKESDEEERKLNAHPLYIQANEILTIVDVLVDTNEDDEQSKDFGFTLRESAMIIVAKLSSGLRSDSYVMSMQKASIIRDHAEYLRLSNHTLGIMEGFDPKYVTLFRQEMERFKELFILWAKEIHKMDSDYVDEWGLFLKKRM
jgi:hypothetical protein